LKEEFETKQAAYVAESKELAEQKIQENIKFWKAQEEKLNKEYNTINNDQKVYRIFKINQFNVFNSDCANSSPKGASMNPIYVANSVNIVPQSIYLICHNKNLVYNIKYGTLSYNPLDAYSLLVIINDKIYLCNKETFSKTTSSKQNKILLTELNSNIENPFDLKKAIGI